MAAVIEAPAVIVTGAGRGIGHATALRFLNEGFGVVGVDLDVARMLALADRYGERLVPLKGDVCDVQLAACAVDTAVDRFGRLDTLVNAAGVGGSRSIDETSEGDLLRFLDVNFVSLFRFCREALARMNTPGTIINISSIFASRGIEGASSYCATKAAVEGLTRQLAAEYGHHGIRTNAIAPGVILTDPVRAKISSDPQYRRVVSERTASARLGRPDDIANAAFFLSSPQSEFINGHVLVVDGGYLSTSVSHPNLHHA